MNRSRLTETQFEFLNGLPATKDFMMDGFRCHLAHAAPDGNLYRFDLVPEAPDEVLAKALEGIEADFIFCGHTHRPMIRRVGTKTLVNPGAVGLQIDGDPRASYAVWHDGKVKLHRLSYDCEATVLRIAECDMSISAKERMIELIREARVPRP